MIWWKGKSGTGNIYFGKGLRLGLKFWGMDLKLTEITEAAYNGQGKIRRYLFGLMDGEEVDEIHIGTYRYKGNKAIV